MNTFPLSCRKGNPSLRVFTNDRASDVVRMQTSGCSSVSLRSGPFPPATQLTFPQARFSPSLSGAPHFNKGPLDLTHLFSSRFSVTCTSQKLHKDFISFLFSQVLHPAHHPILTDHFPSALRLRSLLIPSKPLFCPCGMTAKSHLPLSVSTLCPPHILFSRCPQNKPLQT